MIFCGLHNVYWMLFHRFICTSCFYLLLLHFIVAWYKILDFKHNPLNVQSSLTRHLHNFCGSAGLCCSIFFLWSFIFDLMFGMQEWLSFIVFLLKIFTNLWFGGKCLLINLMNILPILVLTDLLYGGFNQIMLRFLFFLFWLFSFGCWYCSLVLYLCFLGIFHSKWLTPEKYF